MKNESPPSKPEQADQVTIAENVQPFIVTTQADAVWQSPNVLGALPVPGAFYALECVGVALVKDEKGATHRRAAFALRRLEK